jgi:acetyl-CoA C-acetyltransferase
MKEVVVTGAVRTAIGAFGGTLKTVPAAELARFFMHEAINRGSIEVEWIEKVIFGNCFAPLDVNISRIAAYNAGVPETAPAFSIDGTCGSAMQAIICAVQSVQTGETSLLMAGGVESMSNAPYIMESTRWGQRIRDAVASDLLWRGMQEYPIGVGMGLTAENLAEKYSISREEQDE